jgi:hypothetical protein
LLGLYIACGLVPVNLRFVAQDAFARPVRNRLVLVFFLSLASLLVNPYGWRLLWNPFDMLANQKLMIAITDEWQPLNFRSSVGIAAVIFLALMIVSNCVRWRKWKVYEFAFVLFAWYYAFAHQRFAFMACVLTAPWLAGDVARSFFRKRSEKTIPALNALFAAAVACAVVFLLPSEVELERALAARYPFQSIARIQPSWRTFNDYGLGGMLDFNFKPSFIDSRNDTFEHHGVLQAFLAIENLNNPLKLLDQYRIDHVLIRTGSPLAGVLEHSPAWQIELREGAGGNQYELLAKSGGPTTNKSQ